jgi:hypothetical protein
MDQAIQPGVNQHCPKCKEVFTHEQAKINHRCPIADSAIYRAGLPPVPPRMRRLPIERGYPVPWFVAYVQDHFDFRIQDSRKRGRALKENRCWLCGEVLGQYFAFVIGPMCAINRVSSEPPSHRECAEFSVLACPFLNLDEAERRAAQLPPGAEEPAGVMLKRNPGVILIWVTKTFKPFAVDGDYLVRVGTPLSLSWWREGRTATRAEVLASIDSGYPILCDVATQQGTAAIAELERQKIAALALLPAA